MVLTFVKNKQITFFRLYKVTYNILQRLKKVVNDQCELKNTDFYQNIFNHYPTKVVKIQLALGARPRVKLRALAGAKGLVEFTTFC